MKKKTIAGILVAMFLATLLAFNSLPVMAVELVPIADGDVVPFGAPPEPPIALGGQGNWDKNQIGLVVERGNGFVDIGLPDGKVQFEDVWGIHGYITFNDAQVTGAKDWLDDGTLATMSGENHVAYGLEGGDDGYAYIGTAENPEVNGDEVNWGTSWVEFWLAAMGGRDCFRLELNYLSVVASMRIDFIEGYRVDNTVYGLGPSSPYSTYSYGAWLPLISVKFGVETRLGSYTRKDSVSKVSAEVKYIYNDINGDGIADRLFLEFQQVYTVSSTQTMREWFGYFVVISTGSVSFWKTDGTGNWYSALIWANAFKKGPVPEGTYDFDARVGNLIDTGSIQHGHDVGYNWPYSYALVLADIDGTYPTVNTRILNHHTYEMPANYRCKIYYVVRSGPVAGSPFADIYTGLSMFAPYDGAIYYIGEI